jgi:hypothetical protein
MASIPILVSISALAAQRLSLADYAPSSNDEVGYYLQTNAFVHKGFDGGYFTICEKPAPARFSHFGVHGPLFPMLYGLVGKVVGWHLYSGPLFNGGFLTVALIAFCLVVRPTVFQALLGALFLATFWPLYLSLVSNSQDPIHAAAAILFGTCFAALLQRRPVTRTRLFRAGFWLLLLYTSLMRISWAMMLFPYLLLQRPAASTKEVCLALIKGIVGVLGLLYVFRWLCAPYPGDENAFLMNKIIGLESGSGWQALSHAWHNVKCLVLGDIAEFASLPATLVFYESLAFGAIMALLAVRARWARWHGQEAVPPQLQETVPQQLAVPQSGVRGGGTFLCVPLEEALFHNYNIWALTLAMILLYYVDRNGAWRMFTSHFLMAALMVIVSGTRRLWVLAVAAASANLVCAIPCLDNVAQVQANRVGHIQESRAFARDIDGLIVYEDGANPWRNTVLTDRYPLCLAGLPPGIGVSICFRSVDFPASPKSKYLLVDAAGVPLLPRGKLLRTFPRGSFFGPDSVWVLLENPLTPLDSREPSPHGR